jgi:hypothetical protein
MINFFKPKKNYFGIALYGNESSCQDIDRLTGFITYLFDNKGFNIKKVKAFFVEGGDEDILYPIRTVSFTNFIKLVKERNYKGLAGFSLFIKNPKPSFSNDVVLRFAVHFKTVSNTEIIITTEKGILFDSIPELLEWCKQMYIFFHYQYGIIYEEKTALATSLYGIGLIKQSFWQKWKYSKLQTLWRTSQHQTEQGYFRDVYQWNLLNKNHLEIMLDGKTLAQHIQDYPQKWGTLQPINEHIWLWTLIEKQIKSVKQILLAHNRILIV